MKILSLFTFILLVNCSLFIDYESLDCDYENDSSCEDPERGQLYGRILFPKDSDDPPIQNVQSMFAFQNVNISSTLEEPKSQEQLFLDKIKLEKNLFLGQFVIAKKSNFNVHNFNKFLKKNAFVVFKDINCSNSNFCLLNVKNKNNINIDQHLRILRTLQAIKFKGLRYVESNLKFTMNKIPNDEFYNFQWNLDLLHMPVAWEVTTGNQNVISAVIDTGIVHEHSDLKGRVLVGADLISDVRSANDGDGIDMISEDSGDDSCGTGCHSFHGTHVAGIIGAKSNNQTHITGMTWQGWILPIRVLGTDGGSLFDIAQSILWSVGESIDGLNDNLNPADVINLSLGAEGHSKVIDEAIDFAIGTGAIVVVASGNENDDASKYAPANSPGAIVVGAIAPKYPWRKQFPRAPYANYGSEVDVVAPGGNVAYDIDQDGHADGILSTHSDYVNIFHGTSMAAPQIAGLAALAKAIDPLIEQEGFRSLLSSYSNPNIDCPKGCGSGLVNAAELLLSLDEKGNEAWPIFLQDKVHLGVGQNEYLSEMSNIGSKEIEVKLKIDSGDTAQILLSGIFGNVSSQEEASFVIEAGESIPLKVNLIYSDDIPDSERPKGTSRISLEYLKDDELKKVYLRIDWDNDINLFQNKVLVAALKKEKDFYSVERAVFVTSVDAYYYKLYNLSPGQYKIIALYDDDNDGFYEEGEGGGQYGDLLNSKLIEVRAQSETKDIDFFVQPSFQIN